MTCSCRIEFYVKIEEYKLETNVSIKYVYRWMYETYKLRKKG